ncbi:MAG: hypothetical protein ACK5Q1_16165, partial [Limnobacter sp.]
MGNSEGRFDSISRLMSPGLIGCVANWAWAGRAENNMPRMDTRVKGMMAVVVVCKYFFIVITQHESKNTDAHLRPAPDVL